MSLAPPNPAPVNGSVNGDSELQACTPEHCFYAFDTLFCALTSKQPISPQFPNDK